MEIPPSEFWKMRPRHFWYLVDGKNEKAPAKGVSDSEARRLRKMMDAHNLRVSKEKAAANV